MQVSRPQAKFAEHSKRMFHTKHIAGVLIAVCLASTGEAATRLEPPGATQKLTVQPGGRAYLFRGFIGLTDWGMDVLTDRINRTGVTADVNSYLMWRGVADQAISDYRRDPEPITIIGHSLGGDAAVKFAERLDAAGIPVSLLVTYDPTRFADNLPPNVERYINLYQSHNALIGGGGDVVQGRGFHGHYASFDLKDLHGIYHTNMEKFGNIHDQLVNKITALAATPASAEGEAIPLRIDIPTTGSIEIWDSGLPVSARVGDTLQTLAATYHVPLWALTQINNLSDAAGLTEGERIIVPRYLVPIAAPNAVSSRAARADADFRR
jgi:LysM domain